jgi:hypothetical protein
MKQRKGIAGFAHVRARVPHQVHGPPPGLGVIVCLVGGGQEIHTGEAGIAEWLDACLTTHFPHWQLHVSAAGRWSEYAAGEALELGPHPRTQRAPRRACT